MKTTKIYVDEVACLYAKVKNDSHLATLLGVKRQTLSQYRHGQSMSVLMAVRIADMLQLDPMETIAVTMYEQSRKDEDRTFWLHQYEKAVTRSANR